MESWKAIDLANDVFGYTGWSCSIVDITPDFVSNNYLHLIMKIEEEKEKFRCGASAVVRISLQDGCYHEVNSFSSLLTRKDVGYGCAENKSKGVAIENAKKVRTWLYILKKQIAVSDARKRALRIFGNLLGNCLYDKEHLKKLKSEKVSFSTEICLFTIHQERRSTSYSITSSSRRSKKYSSCFKSSSEASSTS